jgi:ribonuclease P protein component
VLARANRLVRADDYRRLVRRGRRFSTPHAVIYLARSASAQPPRFGFIVPKTVGIAVDRNLVRRRLKALSYSVIESVAPGTDVVIRALPGSAQLGWDTLRAEISEAMDGGVLRP